LLCNTFSCSLLVGLEVHHVDWIKADQGHEKPDVSLCEHVSSNIATPAQNTLAAIQRGEELTVGKKDIDSFSNWSNV
jgi:hypothetical protein